MSALRLLERRVQTCVRVIYSCCTTLRDLYRIRMVSGFREAEWKPMHTAVRNALLECSRETRVELAARLPSCLGSLACAPCRPEGLASDMRAAIVPTLCMLALHKSSFEWTETRRVASPHRRSAEPPGGLRPDHRDRPRRRRAAGFRTKPRTRRRQPRTLTTHPAPCSTCAKNTSSERNPTPPRIVQ